MVLESEFHHLLWILLGVRWQIVGLLWDVIAQYRIGTDRIILVLENGSDLFPVTVAMRLHEFTTVLQKDKVLNTME